MSMRESTGDRDGQLGRKRVILVSVSIVAAILLVVPLVIFRAHNRDENLPTVADSSGDGLAFPTETPQSQPVQIPVTPSQPPASPSAGAAPTDSPSPVTYRGFAGFGCPNTSAASYANVGPYVDGALGWYITSGGAAIGSCTGQAVAMPMSGDKAADDPTAYTQWVFHVGSSSQRCTVQVYVPGGSRNDAAATAAFYTVHDSASTPAYASFTINQAANRSTWIVAGTFPVHGTDLIVVLHNRGQDWIGAVSTGAHLGAAQMSAVCTD